MGVCQQDLVGNGEDVKSKRGVEDVMIIGSRAWGEGWRLQEIGSRGGYQGEEVRMGWGYTVVSINPLTFSQVN